MSQRDRDIEKGALSVLHRRVTRVAAEYRSLMTGNLLGGGGGTVLRSREVPSLPPPPPTQMTSGSGISVIINKCAKVGGWVSGR